MRFTATRSKRFLPIPRAAALVLGVAAASAGWSQTSFSFSGEGGDTGKQASDTATASNAFGNRGPSGVPVLDQSSHYKGKSKFSEGSGFYRPYTLSPRPVYRTGIGTDPIRRNTFSLGYISHGGYGSYYY